MIAIADGGSTKCDWVILDDDKNEYLKTTTSGFNPNIITSELILKILNENTLLTDLKFKLNKVFYYGAGCGTEGNKNIVKKQLQTYFPNAEISVNEDLTAAAYAGYNGVPAIISILGTGSNSCFFDGKHIRKDLPSLGFLIGDEGSGNAIGKQLLRKFFMKKLPTDLHQAFIDTYHLTLDEVIKNMYHNPRANAYLGAFNKFVSERKQHPYFQNMIFDEMKNFLYYHILPYPEAREVEINFVGYIAYIYEDILRTAAAEFHLKIGNIIHKPIDTLVDYHCKYIF